VLFRSRFQPEARRSVISTPGALKLLGGNGTETVDCAEIARIQEALVGGYVLRPHPRISAGTRVRVCRGIFDGVEGIVKELRRNCGVIIALSAIEQYFSLEADLNDIEVLGKAVACAGK
jgi:transcription antitermination factor NusG